VAPDIPNPYAPPAASQPINGDALAQHLDGIVFPLRLSFRSLALAPRIDITDANGRHVLHARQKFFSLREHVDVFTDTAATTRLAQIHPDHIPGWSARYRFTDTSNHTTGTIGRQHRRSLWHARYSLLSPDNSTPLFTIREENPVAKTIDRTLSQIPILNFLTIPIFQPSYLASSPSGTHTLRLIKRPAFRQGTFSIESSSPASPLEILNLLLSFLMLAILEHRRG
jgi:hypothetical protein